MSDSHALLWFDMFPLEAIFGLAERYLVHWDAPSGKFFGNAACGGPTPRVYRSARVAIGQP
ncbi:MULTISPECIES: hypothetical protein [Aeromonas]|uniref:hypothetical protein n=1 Tax=Aeromonas hydrophila TaxID=644 RepID=UPI00244F5889|nr:hypothetical protein [Aeromonas caviae]